MAGYFPVRLADVVAVDVHPLRNEILATELVNDIFEMGGITYAHRLGGNRCDTGGHLACLCCRDGSV